MRRFRAPVDPHLNPMRAPSAQGQHPHVHRFEDEVQNPQDMYEQRDGSANYRPVPRAAAHRRPMGAPPQQAPGLFDNPLVVFGLGALAIYALARLTESNDDEDRPRRNPTPAPTPQPSVVVVSPQGIPVQTATTTSPTTIPALPPVPAPTPAVQTVTVEASERTSEPVKTVKKRTVSPERRAQMKKAAAKQGRYTSGSKKGQFKPKRKK